MLLTTYQFLSSFPVPDSYHTNSPLFWIQTVTDVAILWSAGKLLTIMLLTPQPDFLSNGKYPGCLSCRFEVCVKRESTVFILHTLTQTNCYIILYLSSSGMSDHLSSWPQKASLRGMKAGLLSSSSITYKNTSIIKLPLNTM